MFQEKQESQEDNSQEPYAFQDEATEKKIKRHINDINDVITEADIENVKIPGSEDSSGIKKKIGEKNPPNRVLNDNLSTLWNNIVD